MRVVVGAKDTQSQIVRLRINYVGRLLWDWRHGKSRLGFGCLYNALILILSIFPLMEFGHFLAKKFVYIPSTKFQGAGRKLSFPPDFFSNL